MLGYADSQTITCFEDLESLLLAYDRYEPLWDVTKTHIVAGVNAQFKPSGWRTMLSGGIGNVFNGEWDVNSLFLLDGVMHGFKLVDPFVEIPKYECKNYKSATEDAYEFMNDIIVDELNRGKLSIVDRKPHCVHPQC